MTDPKPEKMTIIGTHGPDDPEIATLPFMLGVAALAMDIQVNVLLQGPAVILAHRGIAEHVFANGPAPLKNLMDQFFELKGRLFICTPCVESRKMTQGRTVEGAHLVKAARVITELLESKTVLTF